MRRETNAFNSSHCHHPFDIDARQQGHAPANRETLESSPLRYESASAIRAIVVDPLSPSPAARQPPPIATCQPPGPVRSRRSLLVLILIAALFTGAFGAYYVAWGVIAFRRGNAPFALFYGVYGLGGLVLGLALWRVSRQIKQPPV